MAYVEIKDFKQGLDTRRPAIVGEPGSLIKCVNAHITRGGDVESRKKIVARYTLPDDTFDLHGSSGKLYVFGSESPPTNLPGNVVYQQLAHPSTGDMTRLLAAENFDGKIYTIAEYDDGSVYHFFNGARVTDWDAMAATIADDESVAAYLTDKIDADSRVIASFLGQEITVTAAVPGVAFTLTESISGTGTLTITNLQPNVPAVAEVRSAGSFVVTGGFAAPGQQITAITADGTPLIAGPIDFVLNNASTALACVTAINDLTATHGYVATRVGATVTIRAEAGTGTGPNGDVLVVTPAGLVTVGSVTNFAGGVDAVAAEPQVDKIAVGGTFDVTNQYTVGVDGDDYLITGLSSGYGRLARTFVTKMHSAVRALLNFSAIGDPTLVTSGTGIGTINISSQDQGSQRLTGIGIYQNQLALFSRDTTQIWAIDTDPANNSFRQLLSGTGTRSPRAILSYGGSDLLHLSDTGIRSLRARDASNAAFVDDIGTRIDSNVIEFLNTLTDAEVENARAVTDPRDGRAWISAKNRIYIFSYFPGSKVSAWSYFEPGFTVDAMAISDRWVYLRSGNTIYQYGGADSMTYPANGETTVEVQMPFLDAKRIAGEKKITGIDIIATGEWEITLLLDPRDETKTTEPIITSGPTTLIGAIALNADTTHFAPRLVSTKGGQLILSSVVVHFEDEETR